MAEMEIQCRVCGCTDDDCYCCFMHAGGPCWWVEADLCSACAGRVPCPGDREEREDGFGNLMASALEIVVNGDQPCDACGRIEYTEETACPFPDTWREDKPPYQHCKCWYECEPCCKCGDDPAVLYGPPPGEPAK